MNALRGDGIESPQQTVERARFPRFPFAEMRAKILIAARPGRESVNERAQVKTRAAGDHRDASSRRDLVQNRTSHAGIIARREYFVGAERIYQVVRNATPLVFGRFGRSNVEVPKDLNGVAIDDFAREKLSNSERQFALSRASRAHNGDQRAAFS